MDPSINISINIFCLPGHRRYAKRHTAGFEPAINEGFLPLENLLRKKLKRLLQVGRNTHRNTERTAV